MDDQIGNEWEVSIAKGRAIVLDEVEKSREVDQAFATYIASKLSDPTVPDAFAAGFRAGKKAAAEIEKPIDMILHCPACLEQHIDRDEAPTVPDEGGAELAQPATSLAPLSPLRLRLAAGRRGHQRRR